MAEGLPNVRHCLKRCWVNNGDSKMRKIYFILMLLLFAFICAVSTKADNMPVGFITVYPSDSAPVDYLPCNGATYSAADYQALFDIIGTTYGGSDGNFKVPKMDVMTAVGNPREVTAANCSGATFLHSQFNDSEMNIPTFNSVPGFFNFFQYGDHYLNSDSSERIAVGVKGSTRSMEMLPFLYAGLMSDADLYVALTGGGEFLNMYSYVLPSSRLPSTTVYPYSISSYTQLIPKNEGIKLFVDNINTENSDFKMQFQSFLSATVDDSKDTGNVAPTPSAIYIIKAKPATMEGEL